MSYLVEPNEIGKAFAISSIAQKIFCRIFTLLRQYKIFWWEHGQYHSF
uniref:ABC transporter ATP-binding protein n=1 Tax=Heterorhabditis bacteriophora TaxID=37862 RepID=A0A1I7WHJ8_HETBA